MPPTVIALEKSPYWAPELQRQFLDTPVRIRACRSLPDLERLLREHPQAVAVIDLQAAPAECLQFLGRQLGRPQRPPVIIVGPSRMAELEWPLRELGAVAVLCDHPGGEHLAALCRRQLEGGQNRN